MGKNSGLVYTLLSSFTFSVAALLMKYLDNVNPVTAAVWRFQGSFIPAIPLVLYHYMKTKNSYAVGNEWKSPRPKSLCTTEKVKGCGFVILRSTLACNSLVLHFYSLQFLSLGDALVIYSAKPIFAYALAYLFLREPCGIIPALTSLTTFVGVAILVKPPFLTGQAEFDMKLLRGAGLAMISMLLATLGYICLRYISNVHYSKTMLAFGTVCTIENLTLSLSLGVFSFPQGLTQWLLAVGSAVGSFFAEITMIKALKREEAGPFTLIRSFDVIFGFALQAIAFRILPDAYSLIGAAIVISCVAVTAIREWLSTTPQEHKMRKRLWFILK